MDPHAEWLETDGLGGFASGCVDGVRRRRYHALLLPATRPPTGRVVLVNGFDAWVETERGRFALTSQRYAPDVMHPDGAARIVDFRAEPWPTWTYRLEDGTELLHELLVPQGAPVVVLTWRLVRPGTRVRLFVRPFLSGRDTHSTHHENGAFHFAADVRGERVSWAPYDGVPRVTALTNASYTHDPVWYRNFQYDEERARGLDYLEDLASPGVFEWKLNGLHAVCVLAAESAEANALLGGLDALAATASIREAESRRRRVFPSRLHFAADQYLVRRGDGLTVVAGYPWFSDWGRDTFLALRGLCIASGRLDAARRILLAWSRTVSEGMLPNYFPEHGASAEYNSVDASLWFLVAVHDLLRAAAHAGYALSAGDRGELVDAAEQILRGYARGTRFGIHMDADGLLFAGEPGVQLTWMDARVGEREITPRIGKPVEVQALWLNALRFGAELSTAWQAPFEQARESFARRFWSDALGHLYDVIDVDGRHGDVDGTLRPNQILAVGGLPYSLLSVADARSARRARSVVDVVQRELWTPLGLRSLAPSAPAYVGRYEGGVAERDGAYHQGTVWPWLIGPFVEAWLRVHGSTQHTRAEAHRRFVAPLLEHLGAAGLGHVSEIADAAAPHTPRGAPFQAWSVGELLRVLHGVLAQRGVEPAAAPAPVAAMV